MYTEYMIQIVTLITVEYRCEKGEVFNTTRVNLLSV